MPRNFQPTTEGLRSQLQEILDVAKSGDLPKLNALVKQTEIPDYDDWFVHTYGREKGESWSGPYGRNLADDEAYLSTRFLEIRSQNGELEVREVNGAPTTEMESAMLGAQKHKAKIFYAGWRQPEPRAPFSNPLIGYFVFLKGRFRWDSTIMPLKVTVVDPNASPADSRARPSNDSSKIPVNNDAVNGPFRAGVGGISYPACAYCPDPGYSKLARSNRVEGTVVLQAVIQPNGTATDIKVVKGLEDGLTDMALAAVREWRFKPAHDRDNKLVPVIVPIEITFRLVR